ncbi:MAG: penicillin-binding protein 2 [Proteobacteria bacterium]|nr:penicillin-binding protein 2 [Pseudomonadota bacterium]
MVVLLVVLVARFAWLQIYQYQFYQTLAENNRVSRVPIVPNRGLILDRKGVVLAENLPGYSLEITPSKVKNLKGIISRLSHVVKISSSDIRRFDRLRVESRRFQSLPIRARLSEDEVARFAVNQYKFPGVKIHARLYRFYPFSNLYSHVVGYVGRINDVELNALEKAGQLDDYRGSEHIGKTGVELSYEKVLHGVPGVEQIETDAGGHAVADLGRTLPVSGDNVFLTINNRLQQVANFAFGDHRGALVAIRPQTGAVLAMLSKPGFDPNLFVDGIDTADWKQLNDSPMHPLINRAIHSEYPPGSTFKPFVALAGLTLDPSAANKTIFDPGYYKIPGHSHLFHNWKKGGFGTIGLDRSITVSDDTFFYGLAYALGIDRMAHYVEQFGFGHKTGIDMPGESSGLIPTEAWKRKRYHQPWYPGETVIAGIGQGYVLVTPLQLASAVATLANNGVIMKPHVVKSIQNPETGATQMIDPVVAGKVNASQADLDRVRKDMITVTQPGGTAAGIGYKSPYLIAAKTGTAQVIGLNNGPDAGEKRDNAVFIAYAPADNPQIAVAVVVENGGEGGVTAGPIAKAVLDYYILHKTPPGMEPLDNKVLPAKANQ